LKCFFQKDIFQKVEDSDFIGTKQLIQTNESLVNSYVNMIFYFTIKWITIFYKLRYNEYDWCPLDIAIMLNNIPMMRLLLHYGAEESLRSMFDIRSYKTR
jgi:hypothetical protein